VSYIVFLYSSEILAFLPYEGRWTSGYRVDFAYRDLSTVVGGQRNPFVSIGETVEFDEGTDRRQLEEKLAKAGFIPPLTQGKPCPSGAQQPEAGGIRKDRTNKNEKTNRCIRLFALGRMRGRR
jgi:hypothetical protein